AGGPEAGCACPVAGCRPHHRPPARWSTPRTSDAGSPARLWARGWPAGKTDVEVASALCCTFRPACSVVGLFCSGHLHAAPLDAARELARSGRGQNAACPAIPTNAATSAPTSTATSMAKTAHSVARSTSGSASRPPTTAGATVRAKTGGTPGPGAPLDIPLTSLGRMDQREDHVGRWVLHRIRRAGKPVLLVICFGRLHYPAGRCLQAHMLAGKRPASQVATGVVQGATLLQRRGRPVPDLHGKVLECGVLVFGPTLDERLDPYASGHLEHHL